MLPMKIDGRLQIFDEAARQSSLTHPRCCAADRPIRNARVPQAIGQSFDWLVPAEAEVFGARVADRPAAFPLAEALLALFVKGEVDQHDAVLFHDADQQADPPVSNVRLPAVVDGLATGSSNYSNRKLDACT
jgi:hypothetical protein